MFCDASHDFVYEEGFVHPRPGLSVVEMRVARSRCRGRLGRTLGDRALELSNNCDAGFGISDNRAFTPEIPHTLQVWSGIPKDNDRV